MYSIDLYQSRDRGGSFERKVETSVSIKCGGLLDNVIAYYLV
jgi:hypothetical protein